MMNKQYFIVVLGDLDTQLNEKMCSRLQSLGEVVLVTDNIYLLKKRPYLSRSLLPLLLHDDLDSLNPNKYPQNVVDHNLLLEEYRNRQKHKEVNQIFFEQNDYEQLI